MAGKRLSSQTCVRISFLRKAAKIFKKTKLEEKIEDQKKTIIELQQKLLKLKKKELKSFFVVQSVVKEELKSVKIIVKTEMKSYLSALTEACTATLSQSEYQHLNRSAIKKIEPETL